MELWKDIKGFEGSYQVSNLGRIKSLSRTKIVKKVGFYITRERILKISPNKLYSQVMLYRDSKRLYFLIHRLVAIAFMPNYGNKDEVNHIDGNKRNNSVCNLEWCTRSENQRHAFDNGLTIMPSGESHYACKLSDRQIKEIRLKYLKKKTTMKMIAKAYGIAQSHVSNIVNLKAR